MNAFPNFIDFYQKPLVPIGENDRVRIIDNFQQQNPLQLNTHWLIAVEGSEKEKYSPIFHWKVVMFPSDHNGSFDFTLPLYVSPYFTFNEAVDFARELEAKAREDQFFQMEQAN